MSVSACFQWAHLREPCGAQIRFFLLQNRQGKTRLSKWYVDVEEEEKRKIESEVHRMITLRDAKYTNFVEVRGEGEGRVAGAMAQRASSVSCPPCWHLADGLLRAVPELQDHLPTVRGAVLFHLCGSL